MDSTRQGTSRIQVILRQKMGNGINWRVGRKVNIEEERWSRGKQREGFLNRPLGIIIFIYLKLIIIHVMACAYMYVSVYYFPLL